MIEKRTYFLLFLGLFVVFVAGCGKDRNERVIDADRKLAEARALIMRSDCEAAEIILKEAENINKELERDSVLGDIYMLAAECHRWRGNYDTIPEVIGNAISRYRQAGAQKGMRKASTELSRFYLQLEDFDKSMAAASEAVASAKVLRDTTDLLEALSISFTVSVFLNGYDRAAVYAKEMAAAAPVLYKLKYRSEASRLLANLYHAYGKPDEIRRMIYELEKENDDGSLLGVYADWGDLVLREGNPDSALKLFSRGLMYVDKQADSKIKVSLLTNLGSMAYGAKHYDNARVYFLDALSESRHNGDLFMKRALEGILIACDWKFSDPSLGRYRKEFADRASALASDCESEGNKYGEMLGLALMIRLAEEGKDSLDLNKLYERLYSVHTSLYYSGRGENNAARILELFMKGESYSGSTGLIRREVAKGDKDRVFEIVEEENMREINRFFARLPMDSRDDGLNSAVSRFQYGFRKIGLLGKDILNENLKGRNSNQERIKSLRGKYDAAVEYLKEAARGIRRANRNFGWLFNPDPPSISSLREMLAPDHALIEYFRDRDTLYALLLRNDTTHIIRIFQSAEKIQKYVNEYNILVGGSPSEDYRQRGRSAASDFRVDELSRSISEALAVPLMPYLNETVCLYIVPPPEYGILPFQTLRSRNGFIIEGHKIHYLPTAAVLLMWHPDKHDVIKVTAVGCSGSASRDIEYELRDIRSFYENAGMIFNQDATLSALEKIDADVLHIGAEFTLDINYPENTICVLSSGKYLSGFDYVPIGRLLKISAPQIMVINSISGKNGALLRYIPLMFLANGSDAVIGSMWQSDRRTNRAFGEVFYTDLKLGGLTSDAFHRAVRELINQPESARLQRWGNYYWFGM